ncbi:Tryptophan-rich sensory protein [Roseobacter fucihabitans]|uniref:Tryptophan-rich sensory protein n=1 Tax=Roseobacter fucihabitans TaxID=1537242 RepID=A0ABZ2BM88_9RHOB|nr:TspO/MBR family protein [Roseobacter litoralis]MBC6963520.1 TspO/MBR family protein [Roseobacter litoralis]
MTFWLLFCIFLAACLGAGVTGGLFAPGPWYRGLNKPWFTPPDWAFPVTWMVLYVCMAVAGARVGMLSGNGIAMAFWAFQIALNAVWSPVFFGLKNIRLGMAIVSALWLGVLCTMLAMWQIDWIAGLLFLPYLIWVTIAAALNAGVWRLNMDVARNPPPAPS